MKDFGEFVWASMSDDEKKEARRLRKACLQADKNRAAANYAPETLEECSKTNRAYCDYKHQMSHRFYWAGRAA